MTFDGSQKKLQKEQERTLKQQEAERLKGQQELQEQAASGLQKRKKAFSLFNTDQDTNFLGG